MMSLHLACVLLVTITMTSAVNPGVKMRLTQNGINYANTVAQAAIANELKNLKIPDQSGKDKGLEWSLTNIRNKGTTAPNSRMTVGGSGLTWYVTGFGISLNADWRVKYQKGWFKVSTSGSVSVDVKDVTLTVTIKVGNRSGRPYLTLQSCSDNIGDVDIHFHGGTAFILNLFRGIVSDKVKGILKGKICNIVTKEVNVDANAALAKMKVTVDLAHVFALDYSLVAPVLTQAGYLESMHKGEVYWKADMKEAPFSPRALPGFTDVSNMLYLCITDYTPMTMAYEAQSHNFLKYNLTQKDLPADKRSYLNTTCSVMCIGKLIPQIGRLYPNSTVEASINSTAVPRISATKNGVVITLMGDIDLYARTPQDKLAYLLTLGTVVSLTVHADIKNEKLTGRITDHQVQFNVLKTAIGPVDSTVLNTILKVAMDFVVIPYVNSIGEKGVDLPISGDVQFMNTKLTISDGFLLMATDIKYQRKN